MAGSRAAEVRPRARPGRPRSEESRAAVLRATSELLHEVGLRAMTTEEIASRSGASKATIYKWWPNKYAVAIDAFLSEMMAESATRIPVRRVTISPRCCAGSCTSTPGRVDGSSHSSSARPRPTR